jgi:hypothetical protein
MSLRHPLLLLCVSALLGACAHHHPNQFDPKTADSRAVEQRRMNIVEEYADQGLTARGAEIAVVDPNKEFNPSAAHFGHATLISTKAAQTTNFNFVDHVRTHEFATREHISKTAWMGDVKFETKAAPVRESWFSKLTAHTKSYDTKKSRFSDQTVATRPSIVDDKPFLVKGRRQADYDAKGPAAQAMGGDRFSGESWTGDLRQLTKPMSIEDVKKLLNKN